MTLQCRYTHNVYSHN